MKAIIIDVGAPFDNLKLVNRPMPEPGRGEVVVKLRAASINYRDLEMVSGTYSAKFPLPLIPLVGWGREGSAVGDGATRARKGRPGGGNLLQGWTGERFENVRSSAARPTACSANTPSSTRSGWCMYRST